MQVSFSNLQTKNSIKLQCCIVEILYISTVLLKFPALQEITITSTKDRSMPHSLNSQINGLIRQAIPKQPTSPLHQAPRPIHGNDNIVAGGNVTVYRGAMPTMSSNQNLTACPACSAPVSITANTCLVCGDDLANKRWVAWQEAHQRKIIRLMSLLSTLYLAITGAIAAVLVAFIASIQ